jgi:GNAT superfamily N-acetyltransferase
MNFTIVKSHPDLLAYVTALQAKNSDALGFLPSVVFERGVEVGRVFLGLLGGQPCGYILAGTGFQGTLRCYQVCVPYDARRRLYGAMLVAAAEEFGESLGCAQISLRCGSELPANEFWRSLGYQCAVTHESGAARKARRFHINEWTKTLFPSFLAEAWKNGRPRVYATNAERQRAYRKRVPASGRFRNGDGG